MVVRSVQDYITLIEKLTRNYTYEVPHPIFGNQINTPHFVFRGHSDIEYSLLPQMFRWRDLSNGQAVAEFQQIEYNILTDFISEACRFIKNIPESDIPAWLEVAQHFGVPTRLLDFTENPLVALYFACIGSPEKSAAVWIINEPAYNKRFFGQSTIIQSAMSQSTVSKIVTEEIIWQNYQLHSGNFYYIQYPWIYKPHYREERMTSQSSIFMLWGAILQPLTNIIDSCNYMLEDQVSNAECGIICKIQVPASAKKSLLKQLDLCGINEKFIYPGIDGVGRFIKRRYSYNS